MASLWRFFRKLSIFFVVVIGVVVIGVSYYIEFQLPGDDLGTIQLQVPLQILSRDGKLIAEYGEKRRIPIPYAKIPTQLIQAVLATEDQRYFQHPGIDIPGLVRASLILITTGKKVQGGSTITMQVARSFYLNPRKTFGRKLREILLALKIDHKLSKQKVLELYLNKIFFGNRAYGVGAAAQIYYGKTLDQLTLDQYAMLAGLPKAPSALNPLANPEAAKKRRDHVLHRMLEVGYIDQATYTKAINAPLNAHYHELQTQVKAPYVAELVRQQAEQMYGDDIYTDGYAIYTTIDSHLQDLANQAVRSGLLAYDQRHGYRGPEKNLGNPNLKLMQEWEKTLSNISVVGGLEPAAVVDMGTKSVTVLRANGNLAVISWQGLAWARPQVNANYLGRKPHTASDILKLGDLIRIMPVNQGWRLAQIPKAEAGMVTLNPWDGAILALVGGFDFQRSSFNRITAAERQPGSSFKPFIYSAALDQGYTLATVINDAPIVVENPTDNSLWRPQNDEKRFYGPTRLREGLIHSLNLVSIRLLDQITTPYAVNFAQRFGFGPSQLPPTLSLALGTASVTPLQMATGYTVFANGGFKVVPFAIDSIRNSQNQMLYQAKPLTVCRECSPTQTQQPNIPRAPRVISAQNAFLITSALHDVIQHGSAIQARSLKRNDLSGKTGTTQKQVDAWFAGYNPDYVALAWVGFDQPQSLHEYGNQAALPMWMDFMQMALKGKPDHPLDQPPGIVSIKIDPLTGKRAAANDPVAQFEYFMTPYVPDDDSKTVASPAEQPAAPATTAPQTAATAPAPENGGLY
jgi:penicillin-binding protein 1A